MNTTKNLFRPCIDIHGGKVKQIIGSLLKKSNIETNKRENFSSAKPASYFAKLFKEKGLSGGHIIVLDAERGKIPEEKQGQSTSETAALGHYRHHQRYSSEEAALSALKSFPGGFHIGGGINIDNADSWLRHGAAKVIITSALFNQQGQFLEQNLRDFSKNLGRESLVIDISAKPKSSEYQVMAAGWSLATNLYLNLDTLKFLSQHACFIMAHAIEMEGLKKGIDKKLLELLAECPIPSLYCGGIGSLNDVELIKNIGKGRVSFTIGSALSIYGGHLSLDAIIQSSQ